MTRKDFATIAHAMRRSHPGNLPSEADARSQWSFTVNNIATALEATHARFDRPRFIEACQPKARA